MLVDFPHLKQLAGRWSVCRLATLSDLSTAELGSLLLRELGLASLEDCVLEEFEQLIAQASDLAASRWARSARVQSSVEWASAAAKFRRVDASLPLAAGSACLLAAWAPVVENKQKRLRQGHWPTRSHGAASLSAVDNARHAGEDKPRRCCLAQLQRLIATSGLPAAEAGFLVAWAKAGVLPPYGSMSRRGSASWHGFEAHLGSAGPPQTTLRVSAGPGFRALWTLGSRQLPEDFDVYGIGRGGAD